MYDLFPKAFNRTSPKSQILPIGSEAQFPLTSKAIPDSSSGHPSHRILNSSSIYHPNPDGTTSLHKGLSTSILITKGQSISGSDHAFPPLNSSSREEYLLPMICYFCTNRSCIFDVHLACLKCKKTNLFHPSLKLKAVQFLEIYPDS